MAITALKMKIHHYNNELIRTKHPRQAGSKNQYFIITIKNEKPVNQKIMSHTCYS